MKSKFISTSEGTIQKGRTFSQSVVKVRIAH